MRAQKQWKSFFRFVLFVILLNACQPVKIDLCPIINHLHYIIFSMCQSLKLIESLAI